MKLRLFGDLETIGTVGDVVKMCPSFKGCGGFWAQRFVPPNLADFIHKGRKRIHFIQNVSR